MADNQPMESFDVPGRQPCPRTSAQSGPEKRCRIFVDSNGGRVSEAEDDCDNIPSYRPNRSFVFRGNESVTRVKIVKTITRVFIVEARFVGRGGDWWRVVVGRNFGRGS